MSGSGHDARTTDTGDVTVDEYAGLIETCSLRRYPRITVAVGFCMYIKRSVIDDIGVFDAETFGRGYGRKMISATVQSRQVIIM